MRLGLVLPPTVDPADVPATARRAEEQGFDLVASGEHVLFGSPTPNAFVALAAAASVTSRVRLLSAVTLLPLYPAPLAAKMAATLDRVSGGRFELGVGVGGENPVEFAACGVPVRERGRRTDAALDVLVRLLAGGAIDVDGTPATLDPLPLQRPRPPLWVGGRSEASMRRAGRAGDVWMPYLGSPDRVARGLRTAREEAERHGRDPAGVTGAYFAWTAVDPDPALARQRALDVLRATYGQDMTRIVDACVPHGTPEQVAARLAEYRDAGAESVVVAPATDDAERDVALLAREVLPRLR
ncbi:LLM class flavin-dependent oxidoreductase [Actinomycetospora cinnamomea]|uniref:Alkanesulfonate monooxygenase SsuD/methylene tetrahydromethanopterin reductase-like flavin-dependent oxidoreductase (Luciferase family) n=1 Tax=Actinomycetospora cinnamomea TaxID=663609 RepID=A0A2U1F0V2_9PSEU|nr:LLM class flavin-dependent oxidoreductase [Actinomycetospora cinnamomea]PVZ05817.1 alkanesulfonate monooxygenase SsuD/methylene tetrahydromethanopterin reductase-like flavin-dependent oxidoreductase (luciferase family) [Actinomycetospora cinnamomea]